MANASQHLRALLAAHLVQVRRDGHFAWYSVAGDDVVRLAVGLRDVAERRLAEVEALAQRHLGVRHVGVRWLRRLMCRGPYCVFADEAVALLRAHGFRARRLRLGPADWRARGWPLETEESARDGDSCQSRH